MKTPAKTKTRTVPGGASELAAFIRDGWHPEWVVLAVEAPIDKVTRVFAATHLTERILPKVPVRAARKQDTVIAPLVAVVKCFNSSWSLVLCVLGRPTDRWDYESALDDAKTLSSKLKTRALAFIGEDTSDAMGYHLYRNGQEIEQKEWRQVETQASDEAFADLGLDLPACYPCADRRGAWLAVAGPSLARVERADLIRLGEPPEEEEALLQAVLKSRLPEVRQLLRQGAKPTPEALNKAIVKAAGSGKHEILDELLARMADQRIPLNPGAVRVALSHGHTSSSRRIEVARRLLAAGADINAEGGEALREAMRQENLALVKFLLEAGADVNVRNEHQSTPLHYAAFLGVVRFVRLLLQAGASLNVVNSDGKTPAQWAAFHGRKEVAKLLQQFNHG